MIYLQVYCNSKFTVSSYQWYISSTATVKPCW